eukprot:5068392-Pyramimonas_sp.AAC.1
MERGERRARLRGGPVNCRGTGAHQEDGLVDYERLRRDARRELRSPRQRAQKARSTSDRAQM